MERAWLLDSEFDRLFEREVLSVVPWERELDRLSESERERDWL